MNNIFLKKLVMDMIERGVSLHILLIFKNNPTSQS